MSILIIRSANKGAATLLADSMRNTAMSAGKGVILIDDHADGETQHQLEKIIDGDVFVIGTEAEKVKWKADPQVILVNSGEARLAHFEEACPGFTKKIGPVSNMNLS